MNGQSLFAGFHVFLYQASRGRLGGSLRGAPVLLLTTVGRKTGKKRTTPLLYIRDGNRLAIVASNGGRDRAPSWWTNLRQTPDALVQIKGEKSPVRAEKARDEEKARLWLLLTKMYPTYDDYQRKTRREIPVVILNSTYASQGTSQQGFYNNQDLVLTRTEQAMRTTCAPHNLENKM